MAGGSDPGPSGPVSGLPTDDDVRWQGRPVLARVVRAAVFAGPLLISLLVTGLLSRLLPAPAQTWPRVGWWIGLLLLAIAGPVIAGTSLFGGRGSVWTALLGALVIGSISNGMDLLGLASPIKYMVTGGVLLLAVLVDAVAKQQRQTRGRA